MPGNTKKTRRKKGRGTQGGRVSDRPVGRPRNRAEARQRAQQRRASAKGGKSQSGTSAKSGSSGGGFFSGGGGGNGRVPQPPDWKGAIQKGVLASLLFFALFAFLFKRPVAASAALALFTLAFYVPLSHFLDGFMYRRYQGNLERDRQREQQAKARPAPTTEDGDDAG
jgi:hypothetical protein